MLDHLKHEKVERRWAARAAHERDAEQRAAAIAAVATEPTDRVAELERALDELPGRRRLVFLLRWREGTSYREIARLLGVFCGRGYGPVERPT